MASLFSSISSSMASVSILSCMAFSGCSLDLCVALDLGELVGFVLNQPLHLHSVPLSLQLSILLVDLELLCRLVEALLSLCFGGLEGSLKVSGDLLLVDDHLRLETSSIHGLFGDELLLIHELL